MKNLKTLFITLIVICFVTSLSGCNVIKVKAYDAGHHGGPPPHAPAHGYRQKHHGHELEYDSDLGVYIVIGLASLYFIDGVYYKISNDNWFSSDRPDGGWHAYNNNVLPGKLYNKHGNKKARGKEKSKRAKGKNRGRD